MLGVYTRISGYASWISGIAPAVRTTAAGAGPRAASHRPTFWLRRRLFSSHQTLNNTPPPSLPPAPPPPVAVSVQYLPAPGSLACGQALSTGVPGVGVRPAIVDCGAFTIASINFAYYGNPQGTCWAASPGSCDSSTVLSRVQQACVGKSYCSVARRPTCPARPARPTYSLGCVSFPPVCVVSVRPRGRGPLSAHPLARTGRGPGRSQPTEGAWAAPPGSS